MPTTRARTRSGDAGAALLARIAAQTAPTSGSLRPPRQSLLAAAELVRRWPDAAPRPPLWGIPIAVKDNVDVAGWPTTAGCPDYEYQPARSAELVRRLVDAGALIIGKTNMDQFASGLTGARSAYGICRSPFDPDYISGGSSSGSALAVSLGLAAAAIGTDTAGSGRVPAAFTNTVGIKPSRGLVSTRGVVPACRSLDCPSVFALSVAMRASAGRHRRRRCGRPVVTVAASAAGCAGSRSRRGLRIGFADLADEPSTRPPARPMPRRSTRWPRSGAELVPIDISPFRAAGDLLYDGPWVAERLTGLEPWIEAHPTACCRSPPPCSHGPAEDGGRCLSRLPPADRTCGAEVAPSGAVDALVLPTVPATPTVADTLADPHAMNTRMGRYTMFANLLDLAALAVPATIDPRPGCRPGDVLWPAGSDGPLAAIGGALPGRAGLPAGATPHPVREHVVSPVGPASRSTHVLVAVVGAHRTGQPLNGQLIELGARTGRYHADGAGLPAVRAADLVGDPVQRPGLVRVNEDGAPIEVELHRLPIAALGRLLLTIPSPLGLGPIELVDGTAGIGFLCEAAAIDGALDITD